jgi:hypothetical protein
MPDFEELSEAEYRQATMTKRELRRDALYDYAVAHPEGFTAPQAMADLELTGKQADIAVRDVRLMLGSDEINLVCDPQGSRDPWLYRLVGDMDGAAPWIANRERDMMSRLQTVRAVASSIVHATDGRSLGGRRAAKVRRTITRLIEDLEESQT